MAQPRHQIPRRVERVRSFDSTVADLPDVGPEFELGGETFHCLPMPAGGVLPRLTRAVGVDDRGRSVTNPDILLFMEEVLCEEMLLPQADVESEDAPLVLQPCDDLARWRALMDDKKRPVEASVLVDVVLWLVEWYGDRPTRPSGR